MNQKNKNKQNVKIVNKKYSTYRSFNNIMNKTISTSLNLNKILVNWDLNIESSSISNLNLNLFIPFLKNDLESSIDRRKRSIRERSLDVKRLKKFMLIIRFLSPMKKMLWKHLRYEVCLKPYFYKRLLEPVVMNAQITKNLIDLWRCLQYDKFGFVNNDTNNFGFMVQIINFQPIPIRCKRLISEYYKLKKWKNYRIISFYRFSLSKMYLEECNLNYQRTKDQTYLKVLKLVFPDLYITRKSF